MLIKHLVILLCLLHVCLGLNDTFYSGRGSGIASFIYQWKSGNNMNVKDFDWCSVNCKKGKKIVKNIACVNKGKCKPDSPCILHMLDPRPLVEEHNKLRNQFARGDRTETKRMTVADMNALHWDWDLAFTAACNLRKCEDSMNHDPCHSTKDFSSTGQNLAWTKGVRAPCEEQAPSMAAEWFNEIIYTNRSQVEGLAARFHLPPKAGHFSQLVWSRLTHVGCAITTKPLYKHVKICTLACNYGPGGNMLGDLWFTLGPPASKCPKGKKHPRLSGLCGEEFIPTTDPHVYSLVSSVFEKPNIAALVPGGSPVSQDAKEADTIHEGRPSNVSDPKNKRNKTSKPQPQKREPQKPKTRLIDNLITGLLLLVVLLVVAATILIVLAVVAYVIV